VLLCRAWRRSALHRTIGLLLQWGKVQNNVRDAQRAQQRFCPSVRTTVVGGRPILVNSQLPGSGASTIRIFVLLCSLHATSGSAAQGPCALIRQMCENAGFVQGAAQAGNGLQRDCIQPIMQAQPQRSGASRPLPTVDPQQVAACRAAAPEFGRSTTTAEPAPSDQAPSTQQSTSAAVNSEQSSTKRPMLNYVPGSTHKINQLTGETDKQTHQATLSRTESRYQLQGTDLGYSFEHQGKIYFLFGDTVGARDAALDSMATADIGGEAMDPERGVRLDFLMQSPGLYLTVQPPGISMGAFEVPTAGISLNNQMYVIVDTWHSEDWQTDRSVLTLVSFPVTPTGFRPLRTISQRPDGKFLKMSLHTQPGPISGLPDSGPFVLIWGTGHYRHSDVYLSIEPASQFESGQGVLYYAGLDANGSPRWEPHEIAAIPITTNGTLGDVSVIWCQELHLWLMTYDSRAPAIAGILFSYSATPWGPWSDPQLLFNARSNGALGQFIHDPGITPDDGLAGPVIGKGQKNPAAVHGGAYAPYMIERWTRVRRRSAEDRVVDIYYVLSLWNPYVVVLMTSRLQVASSGDMAVPR